MNNGSQQSSGVQLLSEASVESMLPIDGAEYGVFWENVGNLNIDGEVRTLMGLSGSDPGAFSMMVFDPVSGLGIVFIGNGDDDDISNSANQNLIEVLFKSAAAME